MGYGVGAEAFVWPAKAGIAAGLGRALALKLIGAAGSNARRVAGNWAIRVDVTGLPAVARLRVLCVARAKCGSYWAFACRRNSHACAR